MTINKISDTEIEVITEHKQIMQKEEVEIWLAEAEKRVTELKDLLEYFK